MPHRFDPAISPKIPESDGQASAAGADGRRMKLVYFVHDLGDPAVLRRLQMLRPHLHSAVVIGFHRRAEVPARLDGWPAVALGRTIDGKLRQRGVSVLRQLLRLGRLRQYLAGADFIMARQLEMLAIATAARRLYAKNASLAYECLDIHSVMLRPGRIGHAMRLLENQLLRATDLVVVSSPAFIQSYLRPRHGDVLPPTYIIENKVLRDELQTVRIGETRPDGPPWRIGWYGVLRCRRSLQLLIALTQSMQGRVVVELRGRPARSAIPDFDKLVAGAQYVSFGGVYDRQRDLAEMYGAVHFVWAIDFYESGENSAWLLPNRLYEGGACGAVPLAMANVETGRWLARENAGVIFDEPLAAALSAYFSALSPEIYQAAQIALAAVPRDRWVDDGADGRQLMNALKKPAKFYVPVIEGA